MEIDRRTLLRAGLAAAGSLVIGSCGRSSPSGTAEPLMPADPNVPAPRIDLRLPGTDYGFPSPFSYSPPGYQRVTYIYDTLLWPDPVEHTSTPWLASSFERSPDGLVYTFQLRDNVRWHDGRPLTADDVVFSFEYFKAKQPTLPPFLIARPDHVAQVTAAGDRVVRIELDEPVVTFVRGAATMFPIVPRHVWAGIDDPAKQQDPKMLVGSGPYRLESYARGKGAYLFVANDDFFLGKPFVKRLELRPVTNELLALRANEVDVGSPPGTGAPVSGAVLKPFRSNPEFGVVELPPDFTTALYWNLTKSGAVADPRFRQACAKAIDREDLVDRLLGGQGHPGNPGFLPPGHPFRVEVEQYPFDREGANRLLDEAGYRRGPGGTRLGHDGKPLVLKLSVLPVLAPLVELVVDALDEVGIELELDPVDAFQIFTGQADYDMALFFYGGISGDPDYMRGVYSSRAESSFLKVRGYANPEFDDLAARQQVTLDEGQRRAMVSRMQQIVAADLPILHLYYPISFLVFRREVFDQFGSRLGLDKRTFVTGLDTGGTTIRAIKEGS